jgi:2-polyprenyl-3-methyl-5-hydroxy-6-metoxy-1,4-benzoquinol methylase
MVRVFLKKIPSIRQLHENFAGSPARHDEYYDATYYGEHEILDAEALRSSGSLARFVFDELFPKTVLDVGCGTGRYLEALLRLGIDARGVELSKAAIEICLKKKLVVQSHDLTKSVDLPWIVDTVVCMEVAEHLLPRFSDVFCDKLVASAKSHLLLTCTLGESFS